MKLNRKVVFGIVLILVISNVLVAIYTIKQKNEDYEAKIMSVMKEREVVTVQDIFSFGFERAYIFNSEDCYLDGKSFARKYNLDISINQVKFGEADYVQRIVFVDGSGDFVYEFKCITDEILLLEKGLVIYPETMMERTSDVHEEPLNIKFKSSERYDSL